MGISQPAMLVLRRAVVFSCAMWLSQIFNDTLELEDSQRISNMCLKTREMSPPQNNLKLMKSIKKWWTPNFLPNQYIILVNTPTIFWGEAGWKFPSPPCHLSVHRIYRIGRRWRFFRTICRAGGYRWLTTFTSSRTFGRIGMVPGATKIDRWMDEMDGWMDWWIFAPSLLPYGGGILFFLCSILND